MATTSKRSGGSRGRSPPAGGVGGGQRPAPISLSPNSQHGPLQKLGNEGIEFHRPPPIALIPNSQHGPLQRIGNEGIEFHALTALQVKEMVSGRWFLSTPCKGLSVATRHSFLGLGLCNPALF